MTRVGRTSSAKANAFKRRTIFEATSEPDRRRLKDLIQDSSVEARCSGYRKESKSLPPPGPATGWWRWRHRGNASTTCVRPSPIKQAWQSSHTATASGCPAYRAERRWPAGRDLRRLATTRVKSRARAGAASASGRCYTKRWARQAASRLPRFNPQPKNDARSERARDNAVGTTRRSIRCTRSRRVGDRAIS